MYNRMIPEDYIKTAEYVYKKWLESPLIQRWFAMEAASTAAAAEARLAAGISELRTASLVVGSAELAVTLGVPLAVWVGVFVALGAPYAEAREIARNDSFQAGFSYGFVCGLMKWTWPHVTSTFFRFTPGRINPFDESISYIAANSYNDGLRAGYVHSSSLGADTRHILLARLRQLSPSTRAGNWDRPHQIDFVIELGTSGRRYGFFKPA